MKITPKVFIERLEKLERQQEAQGKAIEWIKNEFLMGHDTEPLKPSQGKESLPTNTKEEGKKEMIERIRRVLKESMDGLPCVEVIRDTIDMVLYEISIYYNNYFF